MELKRNFLKGVMDKDSDERLLEPGRMRDAINIRVLSSEGSDVGAIENCLGNELITDLNLGNNPITIGSDKEVSINKIYWLVRSDSGTFFIEYDTEKKEAVKILEDTRLGSERVLNLQPNFLVNRIIIIVDTDNHRTFACWTDYNDPIRFVNIERAKTYGVNGFGQDEITLIKKPPFSKPKLTLVKNPALNTENNLSEKFLIFAYRYKYLDDEYSAFSPFTKVAFLPKNFSYNFATSSNESMVNQYNEISLEFNTGSHLVKEIEILFKESNNNTVYRVSPYKKSDEGWDDNENVTVAFNNNKIHSIVPTDELKRLYDGVPDKAFAAAYIGGQLMFANYVENKNIERNNIPVIINLSLDQKNEKVSEGAPYNSVKTIRDYEVGMAYLDEYGRLTSVLTSVDNTVFIPNEFCGRKNSLFATIKHKAPEFAKGYRLFIKQSKTLYDTIVPTLFYEDKQYRWVYLQSGEGDKIKEGDYLIVKADSKGILNRHIETRVIEIKQQPKNFLESDPDEPLVKQIPGNYFKVVADKFSLSESDFTHYTFQNKGDTKNSYALGNLSNVIEYPVYYGFEGLDDLSAHGVYTNDLKDIRYLIEIQDVSGEVDKFKWSDDDGASWTENVEITQGYQELNHGVKIKFNYKTGHSLTDEWVVPARGKQGDGYGLPGAGIGVHHEDRAYSALIGTEDDVIYPGATIKITYSEYGRHQANTTVVYTASRGYDNIEEWWINDHAEDDFPFEFNHYWFRRGKIVFLDGSDLGAFTQDPSGRMCMIFRSIGAKKGSGNAILVTRIEITQSNNLLMFETKSLEENSDIFYEIGNTYEIDNDGNHLGAEGDTPQIGNRPAIIKLDWFNCFGWGNGFESFKIKDQLNSKDMGIGARAHGTLENYRTNKRIASITWGGVYEQSTEYNALNEFNLSKTNWIDLDDAFGSIQLLHSKDSNLIAIQENRIQPIGYKKTQFFDQAGNPTVAKSDQVLSLFNAYAGEYGISTAPESFAYHGNRLYFVDTRRGTPIRLSNNGVTELSMYGHKAFFKDMFRRFPKAKYYGAYDPYFDEYVLTIYLNEVSTIYGGFSIGFSEDTLGWTSRYTFKSEGMVGINNHFYSFKKGQLYKHNSLNVPRNNFYGSQFGSMVEVIFNDSPSDDKIFKALSFEGNKPWEAYLQSNLTKGSINTQEFENRESRWFAYTRRNEESNDKTGMNVMGIGEVMRVEGRTLYFTLLPDYLTTNDKIFAFGLSESQDIFLGEIEQINPANKSITVQYLNHNPASNSYCYATKDSRSEAGSMRGYYMKTKLINNDTDKVELFSVNSKIAKSNV